MEELIEAPVKRQDKINERIPWTNKPRVVIIGGGFAGIELVRTLSKQDVQIVMIDKHNHHTFIPLLYQVATAGLSPGDISSPLREFLKENKNFHFRLAKVKQIHADDKKVETNLGFLKYDILVIASGATTNFFGNDQLKAKAMKLREMSDAIELRTRLITNFEKALQLYEDEKDELEKHMNIVIVGAGPTGVELAGAIGELKKHVLPNDYPELDFSKMKIHLVEGLDKVLAAMSDKAGKKAEKYLDHFEVDVHLGKFVEKYEDGIAHLSDGSTLKTYCLIWAAGVKGNLIAGLREGAVEKGRIIVDQHNLVKGHEYVYAIGDVAMQKSEAYPKGLPQLAPVAIQQANHLGTNLKRLFAKKEMKPFKYVDKGTMATIGRNRAVVDGPFKMTIGGFIGWFVWMFVHLFSIIGIRRKLLVFANWVWNYFTYNRGNRLIINKDLDDV
ncbi:NAD(P)/FAD-dependent oxidoreductase [Marinoscillum furvescens]|uniref:NADH:ubiquinone reductase (non-electrogenic) n=1 Tax=Marinoscillum furvescens DSM 4134 TaxID=1122208 RepID=A0A3D9LKD3_MARFU|nr:NAD(P)/FAD-dependent oxidoreductase [Marinoscillum furvescens]REE05702.1 NADH dehydrogenase FAD-containing subunit [Marinoscillum furvescens DSM 4134]